jgi:uncharacterized damage-inducible protein DinB
MSWQSVLIERVKDAYRAAEGLLALVEDEQLGWKPVTGENWMTTGQLLHHLSDACGSMFKGFITGEWVFEESAGACPSVKEARARLLADKALALELLEGLSDDDLADRMVQAPWEKKPRPLGYSLSQMVTHLDVHKSQLFYYLKLQGKPVNTMHLWGMANGD